jgi:hypothetical protein
MNVDHINQKDFANQLSNSSEVVSLDELLSSQAKKMGKSEPTHRSEAQTLSAPAGDPDTPPVSIEERLFKEFSEKVTDGTVRTREEIAQLLNDTAKEVGVPDYDLRTKKFALYAAVQTVDAGTGNEDLRKTLMDEFVGLWNAEKQHRKLLGKIISPTVANGGLDWYGNRVNDLFKRG